MSVLKRLGALAGVLGLAAIGTAAIPHQADAWVRFGVVIPPVVVGPPVYASPPVYVAPAPAYYPPAYYPPPAYYAPRPRVWIPPHWNGPYWVPGHWA